MFLSSFWKKAVVLFLEFKCVLKVARKPQQQYSFCHSAILLGINGGRGEVMLLEEGCKTSQFGEGKFLQLGDASLF